MSKSADLWRKRQQTYKPPLPTLCIVCGRTCTAGQTDERGNPCHLVCTETSAGTEPAGKEKEIK